MRQTTNQKSTKIQEFMIWIVAHRTNKKKMPMPNKKNTFKNIHWPRVCVCVCWALFNAHQNICTSNFRVEDKSWHSVCVVFFFFF